MVLLATLYLSFDTYAMVSAGLIFGLALIAGLGNLLLDYLSWGDWDAHWFLTGAFTGAAMGFCIAFFLLAVIA